MKALISSKFGKNIFLYMISQIIKIIFILKMNIGKIFQMKKIKELEPELGWHTMVIAKLSQIL